MYEYLRGTIPKKDEAGKVIDMHSLRHTYCTRLARAGVPLQMAQRLMRHSTPALTANFYTHLDLCDKREALDLLPAIRQNSAGEEAQPKVMHGHENAPPPRPPICPPTDGKRGHLTAFLGKNIANHASMQAAGKDFTNRPIDGGIHGVAGDGVKKEMVGDTRIELVTSTMSTWRSNQLS